MTPDWLYAFGLGILSGWLVLLAVVALLARMARGRGDEGGRARYECRACGAAPLDGEQDAKEHALTHAAIDELNYAEVLREVA